MSSVVGLALDAFLFAVDILNLADDSLRLFALVPECWPVHVFSALGVVYNLQHIFCRVLLIITVPSAIGLEVVQHGARVLANVSEVDGLATLRKEEKTIECLKEDSARLVNGTENSLTIVGELAEECTNSPGGLRVETTVMLLAMVIKESDLITNLVGSSKNNSNFGLAASSTPIVRSFRCSTLRPSPGTPTTASAKSSMLSILMTSST